MESVVDKMDEFKKVFNEDLFYDNEALLRKANYDDGLKKGLEQGIEQTKIETAKKMLNEGFELEVICKITELPMEEIEKLKQ